MALVLAGEAEPIVAGLLGGITTTGGPTAEQMIVLDSIARHLFGRPDIDLQNVTPLSPDELVKRLTRHEARLRFAEIMMTLELCRHPMTIEQVDLAEKYVAAMGIDGLEIESTRTAIVKGAEAAATDLERCYQRILPEISELSLPSTRQTRPCTRRSTEGAAGPARGHTGLPVPGVLPPQQH